MNRTEEDERMNDSIITAAIAFIQDLFRGNSGGHDAAHSLRVYRNALRIAEGEPGCDMEIVALAALLHDADDHKLFHTENNANARSFLTAQKVAQEKTERICEEIKAFVTRIMGS